jgi:hypothetical protein
MPAQLFVLLPPPNFKMFNSFDSEGDFLGEVEVSPSLSNGFAVVKEAEVDLSLEGSG